MRKPKVISLLSLSLITAWIIAYLETYMAMAAWESIGPELDASMYVKLSTGLVWGIFFALQHRPSSQSSEIIDSYWGNATRV